MHLCCLRHAMHSYKEKTLKTLEQLGVKTKREFITESSSTELGDIELSSSTRKATQLTMTLAQPAPLTATFNAEGLGHKVAKIFKSEIQTGDDSFDEAVYISTQTPEATAHMLQSADLRALIRGLLADGPVTISGTTVTVTVAGHVEGEAESAVRLLNALLR
jgi:hypothetical protein